MKRIVRKISRKHKRQQHKKNLNFLQAVRLYSGLPVMA